MLGSSKDTSAVSSTNCSKGSAGLSLLFTSVCGGENSVLNGQEEESAWWLESIEDGGSSEPRTRVTLTADMAVLKQIAAGSCFHSTPW